MISDIAGPMFAAFVHDRTGSYDIAFMVFMGFFLLAAILVWLARPPVHPDETVPASTSTSEAPAP
ncbi:MAG: MFS transporter [Dehalococcoidia bacterium]|nr:MFS transporter [Dehalococcoidia bacterium]